MTGSVHGNDCHSSCTGSQEYDTSTVVSARAHQFVLGCTSQEYDTSTVVSARAHEFHSLTSYFSRLTLCGLSVPVTTMNGLQKAMSTTPVQW